MPTGYTAAVGDGKVTDLKPFVEDCARAFGYLYEMRDESQDAKIPDKFAVDPYHHNEKLKDIKELEKLLMKSDKELRQIFQKEQIKHQQKTEKYNKEKLEKKKLYDSMIAKVKAWQIPSPEHVGLKNFMLKQLEESIEYDCSPFDFYGVVSFGEWRQAKIDSLKRSIKYHGEAYEKEVENRKKQNEWIRLLKESLKEMK